jgi:putative hemolysin
MDALLASYEHLIAMAVLLALSATCSGAETAIFSLRPADLNRFRRADGPISRAVLALHGDLRAFLMTVLFCNMVINIAFFCSSTMLAARVAGQDRRFAVGVGVASLLLIIVLGEVTPKTIATVAGPFFCRLTAMPMFAAHRVLWGVRVVLGRFLAVGERLAGIRPPSQSVKADELRLLVELSREEGAISSSEHGLMDRILQLPEVRMDELMTPRPDMVTIDLDADIQMLLERARQSCHSKLPVRDPERDEITGWVDARTVLVAGGEGAVRPHVQPVTFISEFDHADQVLAEFREERIRLAIVVDERGATVGLVTRWDLVSAIFGEIGDEDIQPEEPIQEAGSNVYLLNGNVSVREWRDLFGIVRALPPAVTVGGLVTSLLGRTAQQGDTVRLGNLEMEVLDVDRRRVTRIRLQLLDGDNSNGGLRS